MNSSVNENVLSFERAYGDEMTTGHLSQRTVLFDGLISYSSGGLPRKMNGAALFFIADIAAFNFHEQ
jgi:hypothetical protein